MRWQFALGILSALFVASISGQKAGTAGTPSSEGQSGPIPNKDAMSGKMGVGNPASAVNRDPTPNKGGEGRTEPEKPQVKSPSAKPSGASKSDSKPEAVSNDEKNVAGTFAVDNLVKNTGLDKLEKARILVMLPMPAFSHTNNYMPIFKELARRGHQITMVSPYPQKEPLANWEDIVTENVLEKMYAKMPTQDMTELSKSFIGKLFGIMFFADISVELYSEMPPVQDLYKDNSREFDLVFVEAQFVQEPLLAFGWKYKCPVITLYPSYIVPEVAYYTGNPVFTTNYVPNMVFETSNNMNLYQRFENTAYAVLKIMVYNGFYLPKMESYMKKYFPSPDRPYVADLLFNVSFTLLDSNPVLVYPYPRANNIREFLGINTKPDTPLSSELQQIMDGADKEGVLLFTLGSHFRASTLKPHVLASVLYAFSKIPQTVIMKWDKDQPPPNLPSNVHTVKWVPQAGILRHRNCRAFFTHSGVHGVMEAMDHGVPLIAFPLFADQSFFATWAEENEVGKKLDHKTITPEIALAVVKEVLNNPKYKSNAVGVSIKLKDVPQPTINEVVYWVEHVLRTKGARHLRPGSLNLWWYQRFGLDVLAIALVLIVVPIWLLVLIIRKCLCFVCRRKLKTAKTDVDKTKKRN